MEERNVSTQDMLRAVATAKRAIAKPDDRWSLDGVDRSGDELRVIIAVEGECVVVTVY